MGTHTYARGETVTLTASALDGYTFYWSCPEAPSLDGRTDSVVTLTMDKDYVVTIVFSPGRYSFTLQQATGGVATVVNPPADLGSVAVGTMLTVSASAATNYTFERWQPISPPDESMYPSPTSNPSSVYMRHDVTLAPVFVQTTYLMTTEVDPSGIGGTVSGGGYYASGATVSIKADANNNFEFKNWTVVSGAVTIDDLNKHNTTARLGNSPGPWRIRANFSVKNPSKATLVVSTDAGGQIPLTPPGHPAVVVTSSNSAFFEVNKNTVISLLAQSLNAAQYIFDSWTGPVNDANNPNTSVIVRNATSVHANFVPRSYNFTVKTALGTDTLDIGASRLDATAGALTATTHSSGTSTQTIPYGNTIKLTATPASGYAFEKWQSTGLSSADAAVLNAQGPISSAVSANITMPATPATVTAVFIKLPSKHTLTLAASTGGGASGSGSYTDPLTGVTSSPTVIAPGSVAYQQNTVVTLKATPSSDFIFNQWTGDIVASPANATTTVQMNAAKSVTATFTRTHSTLTIQVGPESGAGSVLDNTTNAPPATRFAVSDTVHLRPQAGGGWMFDHWEVDGVAAGYVVPLAVAMTTNRTVKAVFARPSQLTVNVNPSNAGTASGAGEYLTGAQAAISVTPNPGFIFSNWTASGGVLANPNVRATTITLSGNAVATANLAQGRQVTITARSDTAGSFTPNASDGAAIKATGAFHAGATQITSINHPAGGGNSSAHVLHGADITLATPPSTASTDSPKWRFVHWEKQTAPGIGIDPTVTITDDTTLCAVYSDARKLTVNVYLDGVATNTIGVTVGGATKYNGDTLDATYNTALALNAVAPAGYVFSNWSGVDGDGAVTPSATVTMSTDKTVIAHFKTRRSLTVGIVTDPAGQESAIAPSNITVHNNTLASTLTFSANPTTYAIGLGDSITLTAATTVTGGGATYTFAGWDLNDNGVVDGAEPKSSSHTVAVSADMTIKAVYKRGYSLIVDVIEPGYGTTTPTGTTYYLSGTTVTLSASANMGYSFEKWTTTTGAVFASGATMPSNSVTMNADHRVAANFKRQTNGLTVYIKVNGAEPSPMPSSLNVTVAGGQSGLVVLSNGQSEVFNYGTNATLTAATPSGFQFTRWESTLGSLSPGATSNPVTLAVDGAQQVTAFYTSRHTVQVASQTLPGGTGGTPTVGGAASAVYNYNDTVSLDAGTAAGYRFVRWDIDLTGDGVTDTTSNNASHSFSLTGSTIAFAPNVITATAVYAREYTLTIAINDTGAGSTTPSVGNTSTRYHGEVVSLKASANTGWQFANWTATGGSTLSNASSSTDASVTVNGDTTATANFTREGNTLTAAILLDGVAPSPVNPALTITADGATLVDGGTKSYLYGDTATVAAATGLSAYVFTGWSSAASGTVSPATVTMNGSKTVTANYATIRKLTLSTETRPGTETNGGTVTASGHYDMSGGAHLYKHGQTATLTATANPGFVFIGWSIDGGATLTTASTLAMSADHTARAVFAKTYTLTLAADPAAGGSAATNPASGVTSTRYYGEVVRLAATANPGYGFSTWTATGGSTLANATSATDATVTIAGDTTATARFTAGQQALTIQIKVDGVLQPSTFTALSVQANAATRYSQQQYACGTGDIITVIASAASGYKFTGWTGDVVAGIPATTGTVTMAAAGKTIIANYSTLHNLVIQKETLPSGDGGAASVADSNYEAGLSSGSTYVYAHGSSAVLSATAHSGYRFLRWEIYTGGSLTPTVTYTAPGTSIFVNDDTIAKAVFAKEYTLTFTPSPSAGGAINQPTTYTAYHGQVISNIKATPATYWEFSHWTVAGDAALNNSTTNPIASYTVTRDQNFVANFTHAASGEVILTVNIKLDDEPTSSTTFSVTAGGSTIDGETTPTALHNGGTKKYFRGDRAILDAASPIPGYDFVGWDNNSTNPHREIDISASTSVTALYRTKVSLTMALNPSYVGNTTPAVGSYTEILPTPGTLYRNMTIDINSVPSAAYLDTMAFTGWSVNTGGNVANPSMEPTSVKLDVTNKTVTANYTAGYKLEVRVKYENTGNTADPKSYAVATGSRTTVANGAGNRAGIYMSDPNAMDYSVRTIAQGTQVSIRAIPAAPGYTFVGWTLDPDSNVPTLGSATSLAVTMDAPKTYTAIFEKTRVKLEIYTIPAGRADVRGEAVGCGLASGPEPRVYDVFYGTRPTLKATSETSLYSFVAWFKGVGYSSEFTNRFSETAEVVYPEALTAPVTQVTAYFLPHGLHRLILFVEPDSGDERVDIHHVRVPGAVTQTYTIVDGRPACVADVGIDDPYSFIDIEADGSNSGQPNDAGDLGFLCWKPGHNESDEVISWVFAPYSANTHLIYPIKRDEVRLTAYYTSGEAYRLSLRWKLDKTNVSLDPDYEHIILDHNYLNDRLGNIFGDSEAPLGYPILLVNRQVEEKHGVFPSDHVENFATDEKFEDGPFILSHWTDERPEGTVIKYTTPGAGVMTFSSSPGILGTWQVVTAYIDVRWFTVGLDQPVLNQPSGWSGGSISGAGVFNFLKYGITKLEADIFLAREVPDAEKNPSTLIMQWKRVRGGSAPVLNAPGLSGFRFIGWDMTQDGKADFSASGFNWNSWPSMWPQAMDKNLIVAPVYIRRLNLTLSMETPNPTSSEDRAYIYAASGGLEVNREIMTQTKTYDYGSTFTVTAVPQQYHVLKKWVIEKATADGGGTFDAPTEIPADGTPGTKTLDITLDYPTKVTAVFAMQEFDFTVNVAKSTGTGVATGPNGTIKVVHSGTTFGPSTSETHPIPYGDSPAIEAIPNPGYYFTGWTTSPDSLSAPANPASASTTVQVDGVKTVTAHFERLVTLTMAVSPASLPSTIITPNVGLYTHYEGKRLIDGSVVPITSGTDGGYDFVEWSIQDDAGPRTVSNPGATLTLNGNTTATAVYAKLFEVTISATPVTTLGVDANKVTASPQPKAGGPMTAISNSGAIATGSYRENEAVTFTATPSKNYEFSHWEIAIDGTPEAGPNPTTPSVTRNVTGSVTAKAIFTPKNYTITVKPHTTSPGTLTPIASTLSGVTTAAVTPTAHNFLDTVTWTLPYGSTVTLSTTAASHYAFDKWTDASHIGQLGANPSDYTFTVSGDATIYAQFVRSEFFLTTALNPTTTLGTISSDVTRLGNPSPHAADSIVTLTASGPVSVDFDHWSGDIDAAASANPVLPLTMNKDRSVEAHFVDVVRLKVVNPTPGYGEVAVTGHRRTETDGSGNTIYVFKVGTQATIKGNPATVNYQFDNWTFSPSTPAGVTDPALATQTFTMTATPDVLTVTANFSAKPYDLTVQYTCTDPAPYDGAPLVTALTGNGFPGSPHNFLVTPTASVRYNTPVTLDVVVAPYYKLDRWTDGAGSADYGSATSHTFNMPGADTTRVARLVRDVWKLTAHISPAGGGTLSYSLLGGIDPIGTPDTVVYDAQNPALTVTLSVTDTAGKIFTGWTGADASSASGRNLTLTMSKDREVTANFANARTLTIPGGIEHGTVTVSGYSSYAEVITNPDGSKTYTFAEGDTATVTATPDAHYEFSTWTFSSPTPADVTADDLTNSSISFAVNDNTTLKPTFTPKKYNITVRPYSADPAPYVGAPIAATLTGAGAFPESVFNFLGGSDTVAIAYNTVVALSQSPAAYYSFTKWTDTTHTANYTSPFTVGVNDSGLTDRTIIAQYARSLYRLRAHVDPAGYGTISASPLGAADPLAQAETTVYAPGTLVTLTAVDLPGKVFTGWSVTDGGAVSNRNLTFTMERDRDVTATFAKAYKVTIPATDNGTVSVIGHSQYAAVETDPVTGAKTYTFVEGAEAMLTATPESVHYYLSDWAFSPDISTSVTPPPNPGAGVEPPVTITFTVNQDVIVTPTFLPRIYKLTVTPVPAAGALTLTSEIGGVLDHDFLVNPELEHRYPTLVSLVTTPKDTSGAHYRFDSWKDGFTTIGTGTSVDFMFDHNASITANYVRQIVVTINEPEDVTPQNTLPPLTPGTVSPGAGTYRYDVTSTPTTRVITATAATGFKFAGWSGNVPASAVNSETTTDTSSEATLTLTIDNALADEGDIVITPQFERRVYTVTVERWDQGVGIQGVGGMINIEGSSQYFYGAVITPFISATYSSYRFVGWGWGADTTASRTVKQAATGTTPETLTYTVTGDRTISAIFTRVCKITIDTDPGDGSQGTASITSPSGILLGGTPPVYQFDYGTKVYLQALPETGMSFVSWAGAVDAPDQPNTSITLTADQIVVARFAATVYRDLTIAASPPSGGSIMMNNNAADSTGYNTGVSTPYTKTFTDGQTVLLSAAPAPGYAFTGWTGPVTVNNPSVPSTTVVMDADKSVQANFAPRSYALAVAASPSNGGTVSPGGSYYYNSDGTPKEATITAVAAPGFTFQRWEVTGGAVDNDLSASTSVTMNTDTVAIAIFKPDDGTFPPKVVVMEMPAGGGANVPNAHAATVTVEGPVDAEGRYRVTGRPSTGFSFVTWDGPDIGDSMFESADHGTQTYSELIYGDGRQREIHFVVSRDYRTLQWEALPDDLGMVTLDLTNGTPLTGGLQGAQYPHGTIVTVTATGTNSSSFDHWAGDVANTGAATTTVYLDDNKTITAYFKPVIPKWRVTLGFSSDSSFHPSGEDKVTLDTETKSKSDPDPVITKYFPNESVVVFYCTLATDPSGEENYRFDGWADIMARSYQSLGGNRYSLYVDGYLDPRARIKPVNPILRTRIDMLNPADEDPARPPENDWESVGGSISPPANRPVIGQIYTVRVLYKPNYHIDQWTISAGSSTLSTVGRTGTDELSGLDYEERDIILRDLETVIHVYLDKGGSGANTDVVRRNKVRSSRDLHDDVTTRRSSGHIIDDRNK